MVSFQEDWGQCGGALAQSRDWLAVGLAGVLLVASRQFWKFGVKHYAGASA